MEIRRIETTSIGEVVGDGVLMSGVDDALDIIGDCWHSDVEAVVMRQENIAPEFFELRTRIAGEILQKFTQYGMRLAIVMDVDRVESGALQDFIRESNRSGNIAFVSSREEAKEVLLKHC